MKIESNLCSKDGCKSFRVALLLISYVFRGHCSLLFGSHLALISEIKIKLNFLCKMKGIKGLWKTNFCLIYNINIICFHCVISAGFCND